MANIEPGAKVLIEISYVEVLQSVDGRYQFDFPIVVAPRYTPGTPLPRTEDAPVLLDCNVERSRVLAGGNRHRLRHDQLELPQTIVPPSVASKPDCVPWKYP